jgi:hypothetical protein
VLDSGDRHEVQQIEHFESAAQILAHRMQDDVAARLPRLADQRDQASDSQAADEWHVAQIEVEPLGALLEDAAQDFDQNRSGIDVEVSG